MSRRVQEAALTGVIAIVYVVLLASAVGPLPVAFFVAAVVAVATELMLSRRAPIRLPDALSTGLDTRFRMLSLDVLTAFLAARLLPDAAGIVALAFVAVLVLAAARDAAGVFARRLHWRRAGGPVSWRNLDVEGLPVPRPARSVPPLDPPFAVFGLLIPLGYAIGSVTDRFGAAIAAQWLSIAVVLVFLAVRFLQYRRLERPDDQVREAVRDAIARIAPEVVLHHSGRQGTVEQVQMWTEPLRTLGRPSLIVVREISHLEPLADCGLPVVWAPRSQDVERFMVGSVAVALYTSDATNINNHLLRVPGIFDVLVGHGDSDEPESRSPIARMYDEIWVAGRAGRERYAYPTSGVPASKIKEIGPARRAARRIAPRSRPVVVYAPTWENVAEADDLSSLVESGESVLDALLARQDTRTVFIPATATGARVPAFERAVLRLRRRVAAAGGEHEVWSRDRLEEALAVAAFVVVDVSPPLVDAIRADLPFSVPAVQGMDARAMRRAFPLTAAGTVLERLPGDLFAALDDALSADRSAGARATARVRIDSPGDFQSRFAAAVAAAIAVQRERRAFARPTV